MPSWERSHSAPSSRGRAPLLEIACGDYEVGISPEAGGGATYLRFRGVDVLRPAPADAEDPLELACFPLVPYANRIAHGRFAWDGRTVALPANLDGDPHPLHGDGWRSAWTALEAASDRAALELRRPEGAWPWAYAARQTIRAGNEGVEFEIELVNLAQAAMPGGLGFHPYFPDRSTAELEARTDAVWLADAELLPTRLAAPAKVRDWGTSARLAAPRPIDHCYAGWDGAADIRLPERGLAVRLTAGAPLGFLHVYSPPGREAFCVEPVSHRPDALNAADPSSQGVASIAPGGRIRARMRLEARPL